MLVISETNLTLKVITAKKFFDQQNRFSLGARYMKTDYSHMSVLELLDIINTVV